MEGLSGFDRTMAKRLESSALAFYELKHQQRQQQYQELQCEAPSGCVEDGTVNTGMKHRRRSCDASSSSSSSSSASLSPISHKQTSPDDVRRGRLPGQPSDTKDSLLISGTSIELKCGYSGSPRPTADGPAGTTSNISFSISRILGHDNTSLADSRRHGREHHSSTPPVYSMERTHSQKSGMASPDSSCRVAGDDVDHDVKNDVDNDDLNDNDVIVKLQTQSPASAASAVMCEDTLHRLSWLQCTRYRPPKLPRSKKLKDGAKKRKLGRNPRVPFTQHQVSLLEQKFRRTHYLSSIDVAELSSALNLTENRVKIWFQNRRARERRGKDAVVSSAQPLAVAASGGGDISRVEDHHQIAGSISGLLCTSAADADTADGTVSPFTLDDCSAGGRGALSTETMYRQPFLQSDAISELRRYAVPSTSSSAAVAAMMRATLDCCRPSWTVGIPRHHLMAPVTSLPVPAVAAADLLAHLSSNLNVRQPALSSAFSPPVNLLRF